MYWFYLPCAVALRGQKIYLPHLKGVSTTELTESDDSMKRSPTKSILTLALLFAGSLVHATTSKGAELPARTSVYLPNTNAEQIPVIGLDKPDNSQGIVEVQNRAISADQFEPMPDIDPFADTTLPFTQVWGLAGLRGVITGTRTAPNGVKFDPLFSLDLEFNSWLFPERGIYGFTHMRFWTQKAAPGITNQKQGGFDFSKREFDLDLGLAWNYYGSFEARIFAYSTNNLNRGHSFAQPKGFKDGFGFENRWYFGGEYEKLGREGFDVTQANFLGFGFFPTKEMVELEGESFKPGVFLHGYITQNIFSDRDYLFLDGKLITESPMRMKFLVFDSGDAFRPFARFSRTEFRVGLEGKYDTQMKDLETCFYGKLRFIY